MDNEYFSKLIFIRRLPWPQIQGILKLLFLCSYQRMVQFLFKYEGSVEVLYIFEVKVFCFCSNLNGGWWGGPSMPSPHSLSSCLPHLFFLRTSMLFVENYAHMYVVEDELCNTTSFGCSLRIKSIRMTHLTIIDSLIMPPPINSLTSEYNKFVIVLVYWVYFLSCWYELQ